MKIKNTIFAFLGIAMLASCASQQVDPKKVAGLKEAIDILDQAKKEDADKFAPLSLAAAEKSIEKATDVVSQSKDMDAVAEATRNAKVQSAHALLITRESKMMSERSNERNALWIEAKLAAIASPLEVEGMQNQSLNARFDSLASNVKQTASLGSQAGQLQRKAASLETESLRNKQIENVRQQFTTQEADVLRDGDNLIVRLKAVEFPSGKADIKADNFALLNKVRETVEMFPSASVVIEGHTDNVGGAKSNQALSLKRAENVKQYLLASHSLKAEEIQAKGMGNSKPVANNDTAEGRSANRRIDIMINTVAGQTAQAKEAKNDTQATEETEQVEQAE